jgi:endonuclease-3
MKSAARRFPEILARLKRAYPDAHCALDFTNPFELLCDAAALAGARQADVEEIIRSTGFFRNKAKNLIGMAQAVVADHDGEIPASMEALVRLPGVGRKTANVILGNAFGMNEGIVVDTHVTRVSGRLGLTTATDSVKIEQDLMKLTPRDDWALLSHLLITHGRNVCVARKPKCEVCVLAELCPSRRRA